MMMVRIVIGNYVNDSMVCNAGDADNYDDNDDDDNDNGNCGGDDNNNSDQ